MSKTQSTQVRTCPECNSRVDESGEETVCARCGLVVSEYRIDHGPEWRSFADDRTSPERTGAPLTRSRHDRGLSTEIGYSKETRRLTGRKRRKLTRLRRLHNRATISSKVQRNQVYAFTEIGRMVSALELPGTVRERACVLFETAQSDDLIRGRTLEGFAAAAVYATCRLSSVSRTMEEVLDIARASSDELKVAYGVLNRELGLETGPVDPREYLPRFASKLDLPPVVERRARDYVDEGRERGLIGGRNPGGFAAACLYAAARELDHRVTQKEAADAAGVTAVTLRSAYQDLQD
jgi:transcription initiation factor TFIIB